jgi:hypothetical protein
VTRVLAIADHTGWAVALVADGAGQVFASRRIALVSGDLPSMPHHGPGQRLPPAEGVALIEQVRASATREAAARLDELAESVPGIAAIALRVCPTMPATVADTLASYWAQTRADGVLYREALATAAKARGWAVDWFEKRAAAQRAEAALGKAGLAAAEAAARTAFGPPWTADHRMALSAAISAG